MKPESIVLAIAGMFFGIIVGWVIGSQQPSTQAPAVPAAAVQSATQAPAAAPAAPPARQVDQAQVQALQSAARQNPGDAQSRVQLGNLYFDAERYSDAVSWYEEALKIQPKDANVSTDLGVAFYYLNQADRALQQFDYSLSVEAGHAKTLLNQGIVRAFGKQDLKGASESWQKLIDAAPTSQEADTARRALEGLKSAHPDLAGTPAGASPGK